ncbi:MAG: hypothetical protein RI955_1665 [Bacteroidota bacterium]
MPKTFIFEKPKAPMMKKLFTLFIALTLFTSAKAQWVTIPDSNFVTWLTNNYPSAMNGNQMDTSNSLILSDTIINCTFSYISNLSGIQYFKNLTYLNCSQNQISSLPTLPSGLQQLDCNLNQIGNIPTLPSSLKNLECVGNQLTSLPTLPLGLQQLDCNFNQIGSIPTLPSSLQYLDCSRNQISSLPTLPLSLQNLYCNNNQINSLPTLPLSLQHLYCNNNQLTNLPTLPSYLQTLYCGSNLLPLSSLLTLPLSIEELDCSNIQLTSLPTLPSSLKILSCYNNQLSNLPTLPATIQELYCNNNQLTSLPTLPSSLRSFYCDSNQLQCLPDLKNIVYFGFIGNPIACLPNYGWGNQFYNSYHTQYPICGLFNNTSCQMYWNISGTVYIDKNASCTYDAADTVLKNIKVELWRKGNLEQQTFSRPDGTYTFDVNVYDTFQIKIDTSNIPFYLSCLNQQVDTSIISALDSTDANMNFAMQCKSIADDISAQNVIATRHRSGRIVTVNLQAGLNRTYGYSCSNTNLSGKVKLFKSGAMKFLNNNRYSITPSIISTDSLIWNVADFNSFVNNISFIAQVDTQAQIGQSVCYQLIVEHNFVDLNHNNDTLNLCFPIRNGYDPNEKSGRLNVVDSTITYTVQFQNTGNDTAQHIIVKDTLSNDLDIKTLEILNYNFQPFTQTFGNVAVFNFPNINLVDSAANEQGSHGFVTFKVKVKSNSTSASVQNQAAIYFDFNPPIYTNISNVSLCTYHRTYYSFTQNICNGSSSNFNGINISIGGIYYDTLQNYLGCDSFITLHLNVNHPTSKTINQSICSNQTYNLNGTILNQIGTYYDTITNHFGCDSTITLQLNINSAIDTSVIQSGNTLIAQAQHSSFYWYDCMQHQLILGATNDTFMVYHSGSYAVIVKDSLTYCSDTSNCRTIVVSGVEEVESSRFSIYPNPCGEKLLVTGYSLLVNTIEITDVLGRVVFQQIKNSLTHQIQIDVSTLQSGIYFIKATDDKGFSQTAKFVKE